jgi:hypothetical protein
MPNFQCSFSSGGNSVNFISPTPELRAWLDKNLNFADMKITLQARDFPGATTDVTFPLQNFKQKPELYKLVYPSSGVLNWGEMLVLISGNDLTKSQYINTGTLTLQSNADNKLEFANMTLALTIPITEIGENQTSGRITDTNDDFTLHLGLLVDERYFIANYSASDVADLGCQTDWNSLIAILLQDCLYKCAGISQDITISIDDSYGVPSLYSDLDELGQTNAAVMLDAALLNCGLLLVRHINGNYEMLTYGDATDKETNTNYAVADDDGTSSTNGEPTSTENIGYRMRAGGDWTRNGRNMWRGDLPASCVFYFPIWDQDYQYSYTDNDEEEYDCCFPPVGPDLDNDTPYGGWDNQWNDEKLYHLRSPLSANNYYTISVSKSQAFATAQLTMPNGQSYGQKIFRETAKSKGNPPYNIMHLTDLANQLAADFYTRKYWSATNENWNLMVPPSGSGWFSYIYTFSDLDCTTRIVGDFINRDVEQLMHDTCGSESSSSVSEISSSVSSSSSEISSSSSSTSLIECQCVCLVWNDETGPFTDECVGTGVVDPSGTYCTNDGIMWYDQKDDYLYYDTNTEQWTIIVSQGCGYVLVGPENVNSPEGAYTCSNCPLGSQHMLLACGECSSSSSSSEVSSLPSEESESSSAICYCPFSDLPPPSGAIVGIVGVDSNGCCCLISTVNCPTGSSIGE